MIKSGLAGLILGCGVILTGCAGQGSAGGVTAAERLECQQATPPQQEACLERAEEGHVLRHRPL
jgi:hypothetical protein